MVPSPGLDKRGVTQGRRGHPPGTLWPAAQDDQPRVGPGTCASQRTAPVRSRPRPPPVGSECELPEGVPVVPSPGCFPRPWSEGGDGVEEVLLWALCAPQLHLPSRAAKQRRKGDRLVIACQEQMYWLVNRPPVSPLCGGGGAGGTPCAAMGSCWKSVCFPQTLSLHLHFDPVRRMWLLGPQQ